VLRPGNGVGSKSACSSKSIVTGEAEAKPDKYKKHNARNVRIVITVLFTKE
jgi:hypothetical protein